MERDNQENRCCANDDESRVYCHICDKLSIELFYKFHLKSSTRFTSIRRRQQLKQT